MKRSYCSQGPRLPVGFFKTFLITSICLLRWGIGYIRRRVRRISSKQHTGDRSISRPKSCTRYVHRNIIVSTQGMKRSHNFDSINTRTARPTSFFSFGFASLFDFATMSTAHSRIASISLSISLHEFPACKHTRTRSLPLGTVGHVMGRAFIPLL